MKNKILKCMCADVDGKLGNVRYNTEKILTIVEDAIRKEVDILTLPEMALTGYSCGDILYNQYLHDNIQKSLKKIAQATQASHLFMIFGLPLKYNQQIYNSVLAVHRGEIVAAIPKMVLDDVNRQEFRWFSVPEKFETDWIMLAGQKIPFAPMVLFEDKENDLKIGVTVGQDFEKPVSVGSILAESGIDIIVNPSCAHETADYREYIQNMVKAASVQKRCAYLYVSSGKTESTTDNVFSNYMSICENGNCLAETGDVLSDENTIFAFLDPDHIHQTKIKNRRTPVAFERWKDHIASVGIQLAPQADETCLSVSKEPFLEGCPADTVCQRIIEIQSQALLKKMQYSERNKLILGVSGGLDSTVALLSCCRAMTKAGLPLSDIIGVTMPGPGTTERTYQNACDLMRVLGITSKTIDIRDAVSAHLKNIGHPENLHDITYEQTQSRERTKILMDLANQEKGIVIGTGDMSEIALGWMSYSGDQISMYGLNSGIPKTVMKHLMLFYISKTDGELKNILQDIVDTPVSPELLPVDTDGVQKQKTEDLVGPYIVHDFYLYYFVKYSYSPDKILRLAKQAFSEDYDIRQLEGWMKTFLNRFYTRQFKRTCFPDGCRVFDISLSPRNGWLMPSDVYNESEVIL